MSSWKTPDRVGRKIFNHKLNLRLSHHTAFFDEILSWKKKQKTFEVIEGHCSWCYSLLRDLKAKFNQKLKLSHQKRKKIKWLHTAHPAWSKSPEAPTSQIDFKICHLCLLQNFTWLFIGMWWIFNYLVNLSLKTLSRRYRLVNNMLWNVNPTWGLLHIANNTTLGDKYFLLSKKEVKFKCIHKGHHATHWNLCLNISS